MFEESFTSFFLFTIILLGSVIIIGTNIVTTNYQEFDISKNLKDTKLALEDKQNIFRKSLEPILAERKEITKIEIDRNNLLMDSLNKIMKIPADKFFKTKLKITFKNESGIDMGGLGKEWLSLPLKK